MLTHYTPSYNNRIIFLKFPFLVNYFVDYDGDDDEDENDVGKIFNSVF